MIYTVKRDAQKPVDRRKLALHTIGLCDND